MAWRFDLFPASIPFRRPTDASFVFGIVIAFLVGHCLADYARNGLPALRPFSSAWLAIVGSAVAFSARTGHALHAARRPSFPRSSCWLPVYFFSRCDKNAIALQLPRSSFSHIRGASACTTVLVVTSSRTAGLLLVHDVPSGGATL